MRNANTYAHGFAQCYAHCNSYRNAHCYADGYYNCNWNAQSDPNRDGNCNRDTKSDPNPDRNAHCDAHGYRQSSLYSPNANASTCSDCGNTTYAAPSPNPGAVPDLAPA